MRKNPSLKPINQMLSGEIDTQTTEENPEDDDHDDQCSDPEPCPSRSSETGKQKSMKRDSVEQKIDTLSTTLSALQDFMMKNVIPRGKAKDKKKNAERMKVKPVGGKNVPCELSQTNSETTIYHNVLDKIPTENQIQEFEEIQVDQEITFVNHKSKNRDSSSSEDRIDMSDELIEVDINEQFIVDCARDVENRQKRPYAEDMDNYNYQNDRGGDNDNNRREVNDEA